MKKLISALPMIGLILGAIAITTEIRANTFMFDNNKSKVSIVYELPVLACDAGIAVLVP